MAHRNPYRPGAGKRPPMLAGRDELIGEVCDEIERISEEGFGDRPYIIWGLRGIGKTALLTHLVDTAHQHGWLTVSVEARPAESLARQVGQKLSTIFRRYRASNDIARNAISRALRVLKSFQLKVDPSGAIAISADVQPEAGFADSGNVQLDFQDLLESAGETARCLDVGLLIAVDELQDASEEDLKLLNTTLHQLGQEIEPVPILFVGAGLPTLPGILSRANSYAERLYRYFEIGALGPDAIRLALEEPAKDQGVTWDEGAVRLVVEASQGYPYFVQQCGSSTWNDRVAEDAITVADAKVGIAVARAEIDRGLYRARWDRATAAGHDMMVAIAKIGNEAPVSEVLVKMGKSSHAEISVIRERLINEGQIYSPSRGRLAFTVPGMADYIIRTIDMD